MERGNVERLVEVEGLDCQGHDESRWAGTRVTGGFGASAPNIAAAIHRHGRRLPGRRRALALTSRVVVENDTSRYQATASTSRPSPARGAWEGVTRCITRAVSGERRAETAGATSRRRETITTPDHRGREALTFRAVESHTGTMQRVPSPVQRPAQERDGVCTCAAKPRTGMQTPLPSAAAPR